MPLSRASPHSGLTNFLRDRLPGAEIHLSIGGITVDGIYIRTYIADPVPNRYYEYSNPFQYYYKVGFLPTSTTVLGLDALLVELVRLRTLRRIGVKA
jgi:hypothetical protein